MKKYKLFLLGGIISILSIGSFTSAKEGISGTMSCPGNNYCSAWVSYSGPIDVEFTWDGNCSPIYTQYSNTSAGSVTNGGVITFDDSHTSFGVFTTCSIEALHYKQVNLPPDAIIPGEFNSLTPAIDGLRGTVYEIIPYVIYIGIGVLLAILGFYAIRWLVNWMWLKLKSYFSSKKR